MAGEIVTAMPDDMAILRRLPRDRWPAFLSKLPEERKEAILSNLKAAVAAARYAKDPVGYIDDVLGEKLWSQQKVIAEAVRDHIRVAVPAAHAPGKAMRNGTPVLTPFGWRSVETLQVGDSVVAGDGTVSAVKGVYPQGLRQMWRVAFNDGSWVDVDDEHLWTIRDPRQRKNQSGWSTLTTGEIRVRCGAHPVGHDRPEMPMCGPVEFPSRPVPLDPYLVGVLLGDGWLGGSTPRLSTADPEILEYIGFANARSTKHRPLDFPLKGIYAEARESGIMGHRSWEKFIPDLYLWNDVQTRLGVLRGLMDADGWVSEKKGDVCFSSCSEKLSDGVEFLVRSLGGTTRRRIKNVQGGRPAHMMSIVSPLNPFRLKRKAEPWERLNERRRTTRSRLLVSIEPVDIDEATCIEIVHPSRLYVTKDFVVTHNTHLAARLVCWWVGAHPIGTAQVVTTANTFRQVRNLLWPHIRRIHASHNLPGHTNLTEWWIGEELTAYGFSSSDADPEAVQGIHASHLLIIVDEAAGIPHVIGQAFESLLSSGDVHILLLGNPPVDEEGTWFQHCCESDLWHTVQLPASKTPNWTGEATEICTACPPSVPEHHIAEHLVSKRWAEELAVDYGEESPIFIAKVKAEFPQGVAAKTIPFSWVEAALDNREPWSGSSVRLGVDIASDGGDEVVVALANGNTLSIMYSASGSENADAVQVAGEILQRIREAEILNTRNGNDDKVRVKIDAVGVGWGVASTLENWGLEGKHSSVIVPVKAGEKATESDRYSGVRAEMWWAGRQALAPQKDDKGNPLPPRIRLAVDRRTASQLTAPNYKTDTQGRISIERKVDMKKRGVNSPDRAEAILLAIYEPPVEAPKRKVRVIL